MQRRSPGHSLRAGYTLLEIIVAGGITTALAAVGVTCFQSVNRSVESTRTLAQLREIGVAAAAWSNDHDARFPPCWDNTEGRNRSYAQVLDPYLHGTEGYRRTDSKFIGYNKRLAVRLNEFSHPITFSLNRAVSRDITRYARVQEDLLSIHDVPDAANVILAIDGCQNPRNLNQANASAYEVFFAVGATGPRSQARDPIPVGPDCDRAEADGWIRYPGGQANALMCDGSAQVFAKGTIQNAHIWRAVSD